MGTAKETWQRHLDRAEELARRFPYSAELMYFYRDVVRFQSTVQKDDLTQLHALIRRDPAGPIGAFLSRVIHPAVEPLALACFACGGSRVSSCSN